MIYCSNCGTELPDGAKFCSKCGAKIGQAESKPASTNNNNQKYWLGVLGIALLISGVLTLGGADYDFTSIGVAVGYCIGTFLKVAIPVGAVALIIWLIKRNKK